MSVFWKTHFTVLNRLLFFIFSKTRLIETVAPEDTDMMTCMTCLCLRGSNESSTFQSSPLASDGCNRIHSSTAVFERGALEEYDLDDRNTNDHRRFSAEVICKPSIRPRRLLGDDEYLKPLFVTPPNVRSTSSMRRLTPSCDRKTRAIIGRRYRTPISFGDLTAGLI